MHFWLNSSDVLLTNQQMKGLLICYGLNVCFPPRFTCWNLNKMPLGGGALVTWWSHEGGAFMNGISALIKETPESSPVPSTVWGHNEKTAFYKPASRTVRNKFPLFISHPVYGTLLQKPELRCRFKMVVRAHERSHYSYKKKVYIPTTIKRLSWAWEISTNIWKP